MLGLGKLKKICDLIGHRTHDFPACRINSVSTNCPTACPTAGRRVMILNIMEFSKHVMIHVNFS
jgi:hypothetical protein